MALNVKTDFGAVGDGVTDDRPAFIAASAALNGSWYRQARGANRALLAFAHRCRPVPVRLDGVQLRYGIAAWSSTGCDAKPDRAASCDGAR